MPRIRIQSFPHDPGKRPARPGRIARHRFACALVVVLAGIFPHGTADTPSLPERSIAITIDDLPGVPRSAPLEVLETMNNRMLAALAAESVPAIGFVTERHLHVSGERDARVAILQSWIDRGMALGNHTYAHRGLSTTPPALYQDDVLRGEVVTRTLLEAAGRELTFFRHPFTHTGPTREIKEGFEAFLADHGYRIAPFSIENADYVFAAIDDRAASRGDDALRGRVREAYLAHHDRMVEFAEGLSHDLFGREIPQILLIHVNGINAEVLGAMLRRLMDRGYRFVSLEEVLDDPAWSTPDRYVGINGPSWLHRFSIALDRPLRIQEEPDPPRWVIEAYRALR